MPRKLLLFPFGGNAREALLSVLASNEQKRGWDVVGFLDDDPAKLGLYCCGIKVLGGKNILRDFPDALLLAVPGSPTSYSGRAGVIKNLGVQESRFATIINPSATIAPDARIGFNTVIMPNVVVSCAVSIGNHCVILPNTVVSHDSVVGDYCCLGSNISVSGSVSIGSNCYIGSGTKIREDVSIGAGSLIGLGSNVLSDIPPGVIALGNPAKVIREVR